MELGVGVGVGVGVGGDSATDSDRAISRSILFDARKSVLILSESPTRAFNAHSSISHIPSRRLRERLAHAHYRGRTSPSFEHKRLVSIIVSTPISITHSTLEMV